jgi:hypothetical protein
MMGMSEQEHDDIVADAQRYRLMKNTFDNLNGTIHYSQLYILLASILNPAMAQALLDNYPGVLSGVPEGYLIVNQQH